jgi:hypothetical protein
MAKSEGRPANFLFSSAALDAIADMRRDWKRQFNEQADVVAVGWGNVVVGGLPVASGVAISFYSAHER